MASTEHRQQYGGATMEKAIQGVTYPRTASVTGDVVTIKHVTKLADGKHYMTTKIDLSGENADEIKKNAAYNMLIQVIRPRALKPNKSTEIDETKTLRPCDYPASGGAGIDKHERRVRDLMDIMGITREQTEKALSDPKKYLVLRKNDK